MTTAKQKSIRRFYISGKKVRFKPVGSLTGGHRARLSKGQDPRQVKRAMRKAGFRINPHSRGKVDKIAARELFLFAVNDANSYRQRIQPIIKNLQRKIKRGIYDPALALKLWRYAADDAAKRYNLASGTPGYGIFNVPTREATAMEMAQHYQSEIMMKKNPNQYGRRPKRIAAYPATTRKGTAYAQVTEQRGKKIVCVEVQRGADTWHRIGQFRDTAEMRTLAKRFAKTYKRKHGDSVVRVAAY